MFDLNLTSFRCRLQHETRLTAQLVYPSLLDNPTKRRSEISPKSSINPLDPFTSWLLHRALRSMRWFAFSDDGSLPTHGATESERDQTTKRRLILLYKTKNLHAFNDEAWSLPGLFWFMKLRAYVKQRATQLPMWWKFCVLRKREMEDKLVLRLRPRGDI